VFIVIPPSAQTPTQTPEMADLKPAEVDKARLHFDVYDFVGSGKVDYIYLADMLRSLDLRITNAAIDKLGGTKKEGEKVMTLDEFLPIYSQAKKDKDVGQYEDFMEGLKVYDKQENGTMMAGELAHVLLSLGEKLTDAEVDTVMSACAPPEDEEGYMKYETFVKALLGGPYPEEAK
jgi:myosin light chain 6